MADENDQPADNDGTMYTIIKEENLENEDEFEDSPLPLKSRLRPPAPKLQRSHKKQIVYLCQYMAKNPSFAAGGNRSTMGAMKHQDQWLRLKYALDKLGPKRTVNQWKICWRDQKRKARSAAALKKAKNSTDNSAIPQPETISTDDSTIPETSDNTLVNTIKNEAVECCGPEESPIGFIKIEPATSYEEDPPLYQAASSLLRPLPARTTRAIPRRLRRTLPPEQFLSAQLELNDLIKELIQEVRRGNDLREERLNILKRKTTSKEPKKKKKIKKETKEEKYPCPHCRYSCATKTGLLNHIRTHQTVRVLNCNICQETFDSNDDLIKHKIIHSEEDKVYLCNICKMAFTDNCDFLVHKVDHEISKKASTYKCVECGRSFGASYIRKHIQSHFNRKISCKKCGKVFKNENYLKVHTLTYHENAYEKECGECGKRFSNPANLQYHMISHTGVKTIQCLYCGKGFGNSTQRAVHTRIHTNERPFSCDICKKTFRQYTDIVKHKETHDAVKKYECGVCAKKYRHKLSLVHHLRLHTRKNLVDCNICKKSFQNKQCLRAHTLWKHSDRNDFHCEVCDKNFKSKLELKKHCKSNRHKNHEFVARLKKDEE